MSLKRNFSWMITGTLAYAACQWLALTAIAKLGTAELVGEFAFALAVTSPIVTFFNLNMRGFQATDASNEYTFDEYFLARLLQVTLALVTIGSVLWIADYALSIVKITAGVALYKAIESVSDIYYGKLQAQENMKKIGRSLMMRGVLFSGSIFVSARFTGDVKLGVLFTGLGWLLILLLHDSKGVVLRLTHRRAAVVGSIWRLCRRCFPLGVVTFLVSLNASIPAYVIKSYLGAGELGIFSALMYFAIVGQFVSGALAQTVAPRLARYYSRSELDRFKIMQAKLLALGASMAILGLLLVVFLGRYLLELFYGSVYAAHVDVFFWVMLSAGVGYAAIFLGMSLTVARRFREMLFLSVISVTATFVFSIALIPEYGLIGAAWAVAASAVLKFIINLMINRTILREHATR